MICPNLSNPQIRQEFEELENAVGSTLAYLVWNRNNGFHLDKTPQGKPSKLFNDLVNLTNDRKQSLVIKAKTLSDSFKIWFANSKVIDENGEPLIVFHGSPSERFREFGGIFKEYTKLHTGYYFTPDIKYANIFGPNEKGIWRSNTGHIIPAFLSIQKPKESEEVSHTESRVILNQLEEFYDGVVGIEYGTDDTIAYVVRYNRQIKSIFNKGVFDTASANIYDNDDQFEKIDKDTSIQHIESNFQKYFPELDYYTVAQRQVMLDLINNGRVGVTCSL